MASGRRSKLRIFQQRRMAFILNHLFLSLSYSMKYCFIPSLSLSGKCLKQSCDSLRKLSPASNFGGFTPVRDVHLPA